MQEDKERRTAPSDTDSGELSRVQSLAADEQFHLFFTTSVIEVPEEMRKIDHSLTEDEAEPKKRRKGGWLGRLFGRGEAQEEDIEAEPAETMTPAAPAAETGEVLLAGPDTGEVVLAAQETGEISLTETEIGEVRLDAGEAAQRQAPERPAAPARKTQPAPQPAAVPAESAPRAAAQAAPAQPEAVRPAAPAQQPAPAARQAKKEKIDSGAEIDQLLRQISAQAARNAQATETAGPAAAPEKAAPTPVSAAPAPAADRPAAKIDPVPAAEPAPAAAPAEEKPAVPAAEQPSQAGREAAAPAETAAVPAQPDTAPAAPAAASAVRPPETRASAPARRSAVSDLLEKIDETQAAVGQPAVPWTARPASPAARDAVRELEERIAALTRQEAPAAAPEKAAPAAAPAKTEPAGEMTLQEEETAPADAAAAPAEPEFTGEVTLHAAEEALTGAVTFQPDETAPADAAAPAEETFTGEVTLQETEEAFTGKAALQADETAPADAAAPEETGFTGEVTLQPEEEAFTGEVTLQLAEEAAESGFAQDADAAPSDAAGDDVAVPLIAEEEEAAAPAGRRHWRPLLRLFGSEEPEEEALDAEAAADEAAPASDTADAAPAAADDTAPLEYTSPEDADAVRAALDGQCAWLGLRLALSGILAAALLVLDLMGCGVLPAPGVLDPATAPAAWLGVHLLALAAAGAASWPVLRAGGAALVPGGTASAAALPTLALAAAAVQVLCGLFLSEQFDPAACTMFSGVAALQLFACTLGQWLTARTVRDSFGLLTAGVEHDTAYRLQDKHLTDFLCQGMEEEEPVVLLSRPGSLLKNFLALCRQPHGSDRQAVELSRILAAAAVLALILTLVRGGDAITACTALAAVVCMGAPLSAMLARAVPAARMQQAAGEVGAVVPGWPGVAQLGDVDVLQVDAADLFPPACARLYGIKTFRKERIDQAILYATGILIESCNTLSGLFRNMIENKTDMLYPIKDLEVRCGQGYVAWCDNCRVLLGTREMMAAEGIPLPAKDYEDRYTQNGDRHLLYLAVSGKLYAMFLFGYNGAKKVARTLGVLRRENIRLLVTAQDPTLTAARIEECYRLRPGFIKVLNQDEQDKLAPATAYLPATDGCMAHLDGLVSLVGGLQAAAGAERAERAVCTVQMVSVVLTVLLGLLLSLVQGLAGLSLPAVLLYQLAWSALGIALTLIKKY